MDPFLRDYYGTAGGGEGYEDDAMEKMAQLTLLVKEAEEEGIVDELDELDDDELMELAEELYGEGASDEDDEESEEYDGDDLEKDAAAKFEEADFLGRVMAHSMWQELDNIQKEAGRAGDMARKGYSAVKGAFGKAHSKTLGRVGGAAERAMGRHFDVKPGGSKTMGTLESRLVRRLGGAKRPKNWKTMTEKGRKDWLASHKVEKAVTKGQQRLGRAANIAAQAGTGALAAGGVGAAAYGANKLRKKGSALDQVVEQRMIDHLAQAGLIDEQGNVYGPEVMKTASNGDFDYMVDRMALENLAEMGYDVEFND